MTGDFLNNNNYYNKGGLNGKPKEPRSIPPKRQEWEAQRYKLNYYIKKTTQLLDDIDKYKQALDEIENLCKNEGCSPCKELEENSHCDECHNKIILDIIDETKDD